MLVAGLQLFLVQVGQLQAVAARDRHDTQAVQACHAEQVGGQLLLCQLVVHEITGDCVGGLHAPEGDKGDEQDQKRDKEEGTEDFGAGLEFGEGHTGHGGWG